MARSVSALIAIVAASVLLTAPASALRAAADAQAPANQLPMEPPRDFGTSITPSMEGWFENPDGTKTFIVGYLNRNSKVEVDVPIGENNKIEPGNPDQSQPTFFETDRKWDVFVIKVPKDFGDKVIKWTITSNGETQSVPFTLNKGYPITPLN